MRVLIFTVLLLSSFVVCGQNERYNFSKLDIYNGLSNNQVNAILKDSDGFLWFGTMSGLDRYDGYSFKIFRRKPNDSTSLTDNYIYSLYELPDKKMWVGTGNGISIYDSRTEKFNAAYYDYLQSLGLPNYHIINITKGNNGRYWFVYDNQELYLYSEVDKRAKQFTHNLQTLPSISAVKETTEGKLWIVYQNGYLEEYDLSSNKMIFASAALKNLNKANNTYNLLIDGDGDLWLWHYLQHRKDGAQLAGKG